MIMLFPHGSLIQAVIPGRDGEPKESGSYGSIKSVTIQPPHKIAKKAIFGDFAAAI
jgi:hypothetical protein